MELKKFFQNPLEGCVFSSVIPSVTRDEPCILGIDEAGRGPVLGPMVYTAAYYPYDSAADLKAFGFADSKSLTAERREELFEMIGKKCKNLGWRANALSPVTISNCMLKRSKYNLNALSHDTAISLIEELQKAGVNITHVYVDTVGPAGSYQAKLSNLFPDFKIKVANKADATFPIVSAASVCAKVIRDKIIEKWEFVELINFKDAEYGSGYPSDPATKKFLEKYMDSVFGYPTLVRFSWSTVGNLLKKGVQCEWEEDENEEIGKDKSNTSILNFFQRKDDKKDDKKAKRHRFFKERNLVPCQFSDFAS